MAFISSAKHNSRNEKVNTASVSTASTNVSLASVNIGAASISQDTAWKKITIQGTDVAGFDKSKAPKALMAIDGVGWDWSFMENEEEDHALVADEENPTEFALMAKTSADSEVEARLVEFKNQEVKYCEKIRGVEFKVESRGDRIECLTNELELIKKEKEGLKSKLTSFQSASKDLDSLLESQRLDKNKEGLGYRLLKFADDTVTDYSKPSPAIESTLDDVQNKNTFDTKTEASLSTISPKPFIKFVKGEPKKLEQFKVPTVRVGVRKRRSCPKNNYSNKNMTPITVIHKPYRPPMRPVRPNINVAQPKRTSFHKLAHSYSKRPFQRTSAVRSKFRAPWVPTVNRNFPTVNRKFLTGSTKFSTADIRKKGNAVKASACWIWKPRQNTTNKGPNSNSVSVMFKKYTYIDTQDRLNGCSRHMRGNISYLSDYEPFDRGYVSFSQGGCKITGKGTIKIGKLEFENMYFVKDLKTPRQHNMYSIDLNNVVPHKDLTCLVAKASVDKLVVVGTNSTNFSGIKEAASQELPGFQDPEFPARVYIVEKAMYGLHQAPRAWYDNDYGGATQDRKSTTRGCQFLGRRLISWQCKKQTIVATSTTKAKYIVAASGCGQVLWIQNQLLDYGNTIMARLAFSDYHNMFAILEKSEHNVNFHPIVDFVEASQLRIETTKEGTKILATVDGKLRTIFESSIRRNLKVIDECLSPKSTGFNEFSSDIATALVCLATNRVFNFSKMIFNGMVRNVNNKVSKFLMYPSPSFSGRIVPIFDSMLVPQGEGLGTPTESHHTPSPKELEINRLKARVKLLEDRDRGGIAQSGDDAPIKGRRLDEGEEAAERVSDDTEEMATVLTSMDAASILTSGGVQVVPTAVKVSTATVSIPTSSGVVPTASPTIPTATLIFITATVVTPYTRRKGKEKMVEADTPQKKKLQEQIDVQVARELEEQIARKDQKMFEQIARDAKIAKIHAEEELQMLIDGLDKNNKIITKHL
nr:putative ribonuclease H-like domain-containing protein [Tanacetum cinerariifolium]